MKLIVGLGNPGEKYSNTRHNIGWLALDYCLGEVKWTLNKKFQALIYEDGPYLFVKPLGFMNNSGLAVRAIMNYYGLLPSYFGLIKRGDVDLSQDLLVIHDDLDIDFGQWKISTDSGSAGHRGVESLIKQLKTKKISRLRLGIKNDWLRVKIPAEKFVLQNFPNEEKAQLSQIFTDIAPMLRS